MAKQIKPEIQTFARIKVIGVGGAGGSAVNRMIESNVDGVEFIVINTDAQALHHSKAKIKLNIGPETTRGLGAGGNPDIGQQAAQESAEDIKKALEGADIIFLTLGAGGGTGSGAAHIIAKIAKDLGILVVAFATKPFAFEVDKRARNADYALSNLEKQVDTLVVIPNNNLFNVIDDKTSITDAFKIADDVLRQGVQGIADLITSHGLINLDFADVKSVMKDAGQALMGIGRASGDDRAEVAAEQAISSPLLDISIHGAKGVLFNIIGGSDLTMHEINQAAEVITKASDENVSVIFGATVNEDMEGEIMITVIATGFSNKNPIKPVSSQPTPGIKTPGALGTQILPQENMHINVTESDLEDLDKEKEDIPQKKESQDSPKPEIKDEDAPATKQNDNSDEASDKEPSVKDLKSADKKPIWDDASTNPGESISLNTPSFLRKLKDKRAAKKQAEEDQDS